MEVLLSRFRNLMVLAIVIALQLLLLAYQVKTGSDVPLIRVWAVTAITPAARGVEMARSGTTGFFSDYFFLLDVRDENHKLKAELDRTKLENQFLKTELSTADRARALAQFQQRSPSKTMPARIIGNGTGANSKVVFIDRGSSSGVEKGMAVITPDGIVGKVIQAYPTAAQVLLITDSTFAAGVISQKNRVHGTIRGQGGPTCTVEYVQNEEKVDEDEWFFTSGDDRVFPKGLPVGQAAVVRQGRATKEIFVAPSGLQGGFEEVLVVLEGVHQLIPDPAQAGASLHIMPPPPADATTPNSSTAVAPGSGTDADRLMDKYKKIGTVEGVQYGSGGRSPNFNIDPDRVRAQQQQQRQQAACAASGRQQQPAPVNPPAAERKVPERP